MHTDDAYDHLVQLLAKKSSAPLSGRQFTHAERPYGCEIWIPEVVRNYSRNHGIVVDDINALTEDQLRPFYDAAWDR